jgi:hypothetical protein
MGLFFYMEIIKESNSMSVTNCRHTRMPVLRDFEIIAHDELFSSVRLSMDLLNKNVL